MSRTLRFSARDVSAEEEEFALVVGFARNARDEDSDEALIIQRAKEGNPEDEGIYVEVPVQRHASYGCVEAARLSNSQFVIKFRANGRCAMGDIDGMEITFSVSSANFERIANMLTRIFRDHDAFSIEER